MFSLHNIRRIKSETEIIQIVADNGRSLFRVTGTLKDNKNIAYAAMENDLYAFLYISNRLKQDDEIMSYVLERIFRLLASGNSEHIDFVQKTFLPHMDKSCKSLLVNLMKRDGMLFQFLRSKYLACYSLALLAVKQNARAIKFVHKPIYEYKTLARIAIEGDYNAAKEVVDQRAWENEQLIERAFKMKNLLRNCAKFTDISIISCDDEEDSE
ncbi:hypothetical protein FDP41_002221 [Naegleria fowleri]|uniref:Mic1 domain-containing protein n=1 Tax=Naegleria fowleri TaxID=5763 RepID=A0A6A5BVE3_NAEFO|nr:uncharacterized protein FDP41_002221 [Naegleria fowleri]KAF0978401.1 hypothetical protein FDP41_002221 [Naegleria fowleri]CAG4714719.1 unnamed protein product [Naegleria fowleri]